jgi:hypothetical protein
MRKRLACAALLTAAAAVLSTSAAAAAKPGPPTSIAVGEIHPVASGGSQYCLTANALRQQATLYLLHCYGSDAADIYQHWSIARAGSSITVCVLDHTRWCVGPGNGMSTPAYLLDNSRGAVERALNLNGATGKNPDAFRIQSSVWGTYLMRPGSSELGSSQELWFRSLAGIKKGFWNFDLPAFHGSVQVL